MNPPRGLLAATLALWGWTNGQLVVGLALAVLVEGLRWWPLARPRPALATPVLRLVALVALGLLVAGFAMQGLPEALYSWLRWQPLVLAPAAIVEHWAGGLREEQLVHAVRPGLRLEEGDQRVAVGFGYAGVVLAAAACSASPTPWLYPALAVLAAWCLWTRVARGARIAALAMLVLAGLAGQGLHVGIFRLQAQLEDWSTELLADMLARRADPLRERTRIGDLGRVKLSDRILMRVDAPRSLEGPLLLREVAFERYVAGEWQANRRVAQPVPRDGDRWLLQPGQGVREVGLRRSFTDEEAPLALPPGAVSLAPLAAGALEAYPSSTVVGRGLPGRAAFRVAFDPALATAPPDRVDLQVPDTLVPLLQRVLAGQWPAEASAAARVAAIERFFAQQFLYSLALGDGAAGGGRTLADFLTRDRRGHCEYFATATVLLLRQAGIPARYAGGYSVQEYSELEQAWVVRARHAHAWALAYVDGRWRAVDTTPATWAEAESEAAQAWWSPLADRGSWLLEAVIRRWQGWRLGLRGALQLVASLALLALPVLLGVWAWHRRHRPPAADAAVQAWQSLELRLARAGHGRGANETVKAWAMRLAVQHPDAAWARELQQLAQRYYRVRFDPAAPADAVSAFAAAAARWQVPAP